MRVVGGELGSRKLARPPRGVRPTSDRVREAVFARLVDLTGFRVLDLYAGTGALGIECLSRGASRAVFVDNVPRSLLALRENLMRLELDDRSRVIRGEAGATAQRLGRSGERFDLIFVDPPYESEERDRALQAIVAADLLTVDGMVVVEGPKRHSLAPVEGLSPVDERTYGDTSITRLVRPAGRRGVPALVESSDASSTFERE